MLLTTVYGGQVFNYHDTKGDVITLSVDPGTTTPDTTDAVEVLTWDSAKGDVINTPGFIGAVGTGKEVDWPDGAAIWKSGAWNTPADADPQYATSETEVFCVYVAHASSSTVITMAINGGDPGPSRTWWRARRWIQAR